MAELVNNERMNNAKSTLGKLVNYVERENFKGYDPYDVENSFLPIGKLPHVLRFILTQLNKRSPLNFRPLLGVNKKPHTKGMGLFLHAYCNLFRATNDQKMLDQAKAIFSWLQENRSRFSENICWGFDYPYSSRAGSVDRGLPTVIHHGFILSGIFEYYKLTEDRQALYLIDKADDFIIDDLPRLSFSGGICFGYHLGAKEGCCYNANLHAAQALAVVNRFKDKVEYSELIEQSVKYVLSRQQDSGAWYYSHGKDTEKEKNQLDFHQGFILDSLDIIDKLTNEKFSDIIRPAINKGLDFYYSKQFDEYGRCRFRYPTIYPVDIHNQAQGIITFTRFSSYNEKYATMADKIVRWTIEHMFDHKGFFYYQKYRLFTNKIPHIRWGQAWMMLALSEYLLQGKSADNV